MSAVLKRETMVLVVMRDICFVVHHQKIPERQVLHLLFVLTVMFDKQGQPQHLVKLRVGVYIKREKGQRQ